jgi:hypothetical protein
MQSLTTRTPKQHQALAAALLALALAVAILTVAGPLNSVLGDDTEPADNLATARGGALTQSELATLGDTPGSPGSTEARTSAAQPEDFLFLEQNLYLPDQGAELAQVAVPAGVADEPSFASTEAMLFWEQNVYLPSHTGAAAYQGAPDGLPAGYPALDGPLSYQEMLFLEQNIWE